MSKGSLVRLEEQLFRRRSQFEDDSGAKIGRIVVLDVTERSIHYALLEAWTGRILGFGSHSIVPGSYIQSLARDINENKS